MKGRFQEYRSVKLSEHNYGKTDFGTILISWWLTKLFRWMCRFPIMIKRCLYVSDLLAGQIRFTASFSDLSFFFWMARTCYCVLIWVNSFFFCLVFVLANYSAYDILKITRSILKTWPNLLSFTNLATKHTRKLLRKRQLESYCVWVLSGNNIGLLICWLKSTETDKRRSQNIYAKKNFLKRNFFWKSLLEVWWYVLID